MARRACRDRGHSAVGSKLLYGLCVLSMHIHHKASGISSVCRHRENTTAVYCFVLVRVPGYSCEYPKNVASTRYAYQVSNTNPRVAAAVLAELLVAQKSPPSTSAKPALFCCLRVCEAGAGYCYRPTRITQYSSRCISYEYRRV